MTERADRHPFIILDSKSCVFLVLCVAAGAAGDNNMQSPRFVTQPSASASIVSEGRAKFLQCQAVGKLLPVWLLPYESSYAYHVTTIQAGRDYFGHGGY